MLYGAFIASVIKLTNLFIEARVDKVVNPSVSIVLEAVSMLIFYKILEKKCKKADILGIAVVSILWRNLYAIYIFLMPKSFCGISPLRAAGPLLKFMLLDSLANTVIITGKSIQKRQLKGVPFLGTLFFVTNLLPFRLNLNIYKVA